MDLDDPDTKARIAEAIAKARAKPLGEDVLNPTKIEARPLVRLIDRKPDHHRPQSEYVILDAIYRASIAFEEQPVGLCKHISVSIEAPDALPPDLIFKAVATAFGFTFPNRGITWIEEYKPNYYCLNLVDLDDPSTWEKEVEDRAVKAALADVIDVMRRSEEVD